MSCPLDKSHPASLLNPSLLLLPQQHPLSFCLSLSLFLPISPHPPKRPLSRGQFVQYGPSTVFNRVTTTSASANGLGRRDSCTTGGSHGLRCHLFPQRRPSNGEDATFSCAQPQSKQTPFPCPSSAYHGSHCCHLDDSRRLATAEVPYASVSSPWLPQLLRHSPSLFLPPSRLETAPRSSS